MSRRRHGQLVRVGRDKTTPLCRQANMAHTRQSQPDSGLGLQVEVLHTVEAVPTWLGGQVDRDKENDDRETPFVDVAGK